jgi:hypothetical protein
MLSDYASPCLRTPHVTEGLRLAHPQFPLPSGFRLLLGGLADPPSEAHQAALSIG